MKPRTTIEVAGSRGSVRIQAIVDTGFSDELCLPVDVAVSLGLELLERQKFVLADGTVRTELAFAGKVLNEEREVAILLTDLDEALIGIALLRDCRLTIDFTKNKVELKRLKRKSQRP